MEPPQRGNTSFSDVGNGSHVCGRAKLRLKQRKLHRDIKYSLSYRNSEGNGAMARMARMANDIINADYLNRDRGPFYCH